MEKRKEVENQLHIKLNKLIFQMKKGIFNQRIKVANRKDHKRLEEMGLLNYKVLISIYPQLKKETQMIYLK
jgi:hypothetical protein